jgi:hypothetical protein
MGSDFDILTVSTLLSRRSLAPLLTDPTIDEAQQTGEEFLAAADAVMKSVVANPQQFPLIHRQTRRALFRRFP